MKWSLFALCIGFCIDLLIGDPHGLPHPVAAIGHLISLLERLFRRLFPKTPGGERAAGACIWILTALIAAALPALLLWGCARVSVWLRLAVESVMCGQILAAKSLRDESMKVYAALKHGSLDEARQAVSMIVGRDVARLDARGVMRAAVETVAENTSDGVIAPMLFLAIGGAPLGFFYKAVNTMDSMLGYVEPPYKDIGLVPARMDDVFNFIPARLCGCGKKMMRCCTTWQPRPRRGTYPRRRRAPVWRRWRSGIFCKGRCPSSARSGDGSQIT